MVHEIFSRRHAGDESCSGCGTPIRHGVTTQYVEDIDAEICAVCEQPLKAGLLDESEVL